MFQRRKIMPNDFEKLESQRLAEIARLRAAIAEGGTALAGHQRDLEAEEAALTEKRDAHHRECKSLARGEAHQVEATAAAIAESEARRSGLLGLVDERRAELLKLNAQLDGLQQEQTRVEQRRAAEAQLAKMPGVADQLDAIVTKLESAAAEFLATYAELAGQNFLTTEAKDFSIPRARASFEHLDRTVYRLMTCAKRIGVDPQRFIGRTEKMEVGGQFV
jgi:hypothetical protein